MYKSTFLHKIHGLRLNGGGITLQTKIHNWIDENQELFVNNSSHSLTKLNRKNVISPMKARQISDKIEYDKKAKTEKLKNEADKLIINLKIKKR